MRLPPPREAYRMTLLAGNAPGACVLLALSLLIHAAALAVLLKSATKMPAAPPDPPAISFLFSIPGPISAAPVPATVLAYRRFGAVPPSPAPRPRDVPRPARRPASNTAHIRPSLAGARPAVAAPATAAATAPMGHAKPAAILAAAAGDGALLLRFGNDIQAAVRAAATMPEAAILQHRTGRAQVRFSYLDGHAEALALAQTSRSRLLDDAALAAVRRAHYPPPPAPLRGRRLKLLVWIDFSVRPGLPG